MVEDEVLVGLMLEQDLRSIGCTVTGPCTNLASGLDSLRNEEIDAAILDINLNGEMVYPLADELIARGIPFVFVSGYEAANLPDRLRALPRLAKPCDPRILIDKLKQIAPTR